MPGFLKKISGKLLDKSSFVLFLIGFFIISFFYGFLVYREHWPPFQQIENTWKIVETFVENKKLGAKGLFLEFVDEDPGKVSEQWFQDLDQFHSNSSFVFLGGRSEFLDVCPEYGCLAVKYDGARDAIVQAYPYRPKEIFETTSKMVAQFPYAEGLGFNVDDHLAPNGFSEYPNGDLLVVFRVDGVYPYGGGVARIDSEGRPVWVRRDYSHHWPTLLENNTALVPAFSRSFWDGNNQTARFECPSGNAYEDVIRVLDEDGKVMREISVLKAMLESPFKGRLFVPGSREKSCDPTHMNQIMLVNDELARAVDVAEAGDFLVSLRDINALALIDSQTELVKALYTGSFVGQHSVRYLEGPYVVFFDNLGRMGPEQPSRIIRLNLATREEKILYPAASMPDKHAHYNTGACGTIRLSHDKSTGVACFSDDGIGLEFDLETGEPLMLFHNVHDVSSVEDFDKERKDKAASFYLQDIDYARQ
jgi:hypothetical protein